MRRVSVTYCLVLILISCFSAGLRAQSQDYTAALAALEESFKKGNPEVLSAHTSEELAFGPYPASVTPTILKQFFSGQLKLKSFEVTATKTGEALIKYDIYGLGVRESRVLFDDEGKIRRIELVDNIIRLQAEAQRDLASQVQAPEPGQLAEQYPYQEVEFASKDGHPVTANLYEVGSAKPVILLCHQAGYNKYEYADIAPRLNAMGFDAMAMDQRSGGDFAGMSNKTYYRAMAKGLETAFLDAAQDIEAAVDYLFEKYNREVIVWGSSYSSSLVLFLAAENAHVKASVSFSPGDYFREAMPSLAQVLEDHEKPFFITSSKEESERVSNLLIGIKLKGDQVQFTPEGKGYHGSRALWRGQKGADEYWKALTSFLSKIDL
ncbi:MAG: hypothetical protein Roseis2KO_23040 [Roseivirga sp.]